MPLMIREVDNTGDLQDALTFLTQPSDGGRITLLEGVFEANLYAHYNSTS